MELKKRVLLVEDEPHLIAMYQMVFRQEKGIELLTAHDGETGYALACDHLPDLILLDLILPKEKNGLVEFDLRVGFDVMKKIRQHSELKDVKVVALTNLDSPEDRKLAKKYGALDYVVKANVLPKDIVALTKRLLRE